MKNETIKQDLPINKTYDDIMKETQRSRSEGDKPQEPKKKGKFFAAVGEGILIGTLAISSMYYGATHSREVKAYAEEVKTYARKTLDSIEGFFQSEPEQSSTLSLDEFVRGENQTTVTSVYGGQK